MVYDILMCLGDVCYTFMSGFETEVEAQDVVDSYGGYFTDERGVTWALEIVCVAE